jgi:protein-S-isoprenylcysteine O-methyltransferase Ste14
LPLLVLTAALPARTLYRLPFPWSLVTLGIQILAFLALVLGVWQTGAGSFLGVRQLFDPMDTRTPRLMVRGLYRFVRHPIYTAGFLFMWFTPVMNTNLLALYAALTLYCMVGARLEEERLVTEFGEAYEAYRRQTPMLIPSPRSLSAEIIHHP